MWGNTFHGCRHTFTEGDQARQGGRGNLPGGDHFPEWPVKMQDALELALLVFHGWVCAGEPRPRQPLAGDPSIWPLILPSLQASVGGKGCSWGGAVLNGRQRPGGQAALPVRGGRGTLSPPQS